MDIVIDNLSVIFVKYYDGILEMVLIVCNFGIIVDFLLLFLSDFVMY